MSLNCSVGQISFFTWSALRCHFISSFCDFLRRKVRSVVDEKKATYIVHWFVVATISPKWKGKELECDTAYFILRCTQVVACNYKDHSGKLLELCKLSWTIHKKFQEHWKTLEERFETFMEIYLLC